MEPGEANGQVYTITVDLQGISSDSPVNSVIESYQSITTNVLNGTPTTLLPTTATTLNGILKGNGSVLGVAAPNTDYLPVSSPVMTGTPTAPTASTGTNTTQIATTAFVESAIPTGLPPSGAAGGDLSGTYPNPLSKVRTVFATVAPTGNPADYTTTGSSDQIIINSAIVAASTNGGAIKIRRGNYSTNAPILLYGKVDVYMERGAIITLANGSNCDVFATTTPGSGTISDFTVEGGVIDGNASNQSSGNGINLMNAINAKLIGIRVKNTWQSGINIDGYNTGLSDDITVTGCKVTGVGLTSGSTGGNGISITNSPTHVYIDGNRVDNTGSANIAINGVGIHIGITNNMLSNSGANILHVADNITGYEAGNFWVTVSGNHASGGSNHGIHLGGSHIVVSCNQVDSPAQDGIRLENHSGTANVINATVVGNTVIGAGENGIYALTVQSGEITGNVVTNSTGVGILVDKGLDVTISNNATIGNGSNADGIQIYRSVSSKVLGNTAKNNGRYGIYLNDDNITATLNTEVADNICYDAQTTKTQLVGIISQNSADFTYAHGNTSLASNHVTAGWSLAGLNNITGHNIGVNTLNFGRNPVIGTPVTTTIQAQGAQEKSTDTNGSALVLSAGPATGNGSSLILFEVVANGQGTGQTDRLPLEVGRMTGSTNGRLLIGATNTLSGADGITLGGNVNRVVQMNRNPGSNVAGNTLVLMAGGAALQSTNKNGGTLVIQGPAATGSGSSTIQIAPTPATSNSLTALASVTVNNEGSAYVSGDVLTITGGSGSGGTGTVATVAVAGQLNTVAVNSGGTGYVVGNVLTISGGSSGTITVVSVDKNGAVLTLTVTTGGSGYSSTTGASVTGGSGSGGTFNTVIHNTGGILTTSITTAGSGYVLTTGATTSGGTGTGATLNLVPWSNTDNAPAVGTTFLGNGNVGFGTTSPSHTLDVVGTINATGALSTANFAGSSSGTNTGDQTNISGNAATVTTNANLTGPITSVGNATSIASQTGTGSTFVVSASPTITTPIISQINDSNTNAMLGMLAVASSVNFIQLANAATGGTPIFTFTGSDTNVSGQFKTKGTGGFSFLPGADGTTAFRVRQAGGTALFTVDTSGKIATINGNLTLGTAGNKINITTGSNASVGTGTLSAGTVTISTTAVTASSLIFLTDTSNGTNLGTLSVGTKTAATSFVVSSSNALDASTFNWIIIN